MNIVEMFSGCGGLSLGFHNDKFNILNVNDFDTSACLTYKHNFPSANVILGDITEQDIKDKICNTDGKVVDIVIGGVPCFLADTNVLTQDGYKKIQDVILEDKLLTHTGKFQSIINLQRKEYIGSIYLIRPKYHPYPIKCTEDHPFYVKTDIDATPKWIPACKLSKDYYFGMPINTKSDIPKFTFEKIINQSTTKQITTTLDKPEMWWMMGYFTGDGWVEDNKKKDGRLEYTIKFAIADVDNTLVVNNIRKVLSITDKKHNSGKCKKYGCRNMIWYNILKEFGKYAHGKKIPEWVQNAPEELIQEFLDGYATADGCNTKNNNSTVLEYSTVSTDLSYGVQRLYLKLGKLCSIKYCKRSSTCVIEGRTVNQRPSYKMNISPSSGGSSFIKDNYAWFRGFKLDKEEQIEPVIVYNFEVENDNSYCVENTICHNCTPFSLSGLRNPNDPRGRLFTHYMDVVSRLNPKLILIENVTGILSMDHQKYDLTQEQLDKLKSISKLEESIIKLKQKKKHNNDDFTEDDEKKLKRRIKRFKKYDLSVYREPVIDQIKKALTDMNYKVKYKVHKAIEFDCPQKRERVIIMGIRNDLNIEPSFPKPSDNETPTIKDSIEDLEQKEEDKEFSHIFTKHSQDFIAKIEKTQQGESVNSKFKEANYRPVYDTYSPTVKENHGAVMVHPILNRSMTPRELARLQTFPDNFIFKGSKKDILCQIGNAVPVNLAKALAEHIHKILN